jgi:ribosome biogenesis GTPase
LQQTKAIVTATYSRRMRLRLANGDEVDARIKGKTLKPVCGDRVLAEPIENESDWLITDILDRSNELNRPNLRGDVEILAANIDLLVVVAAATPKPDWFVVDRYLCAAENMGTQSAVLFNKTDLSGADSNLGDYAVIGYNTVQCSAESGENIDQVASLFGDQTAIVVGQSGVGKSSIINALLGANALRTAEISGKSGEGRHTTVNSEMLRLPGGGTVIDSPGVRDYAPALADAKQVLRGFREIDAAGQDCRFANCRHLREPGCAAKAAVETAKISARRYESYKRLLALTEKLEQQ